MSEESEEIISHSSTSSAELIAPPSYSDKIECCGQSIVSISQGIGSSEVPDSDQLEGSVPSISQGIEANHASSGTLLSREI